MICVLTGLLLAGAHAAADAQTRVKDIAYVQGVRGQQVIGYGLVVGLNRTGDTHRSAFTQQSVESMLKRFGITVPPGDARMRNTAAVIVTATVPAFTKEGGIVDVIVSSIGDASGLQGGTLLMTPLSGPDGRVYATAQGPISVGGMGVREGGAEVRRNHTAAGRIPGGAILERSIPTEFTAEGSVSVVLRQSDFTNANRIAEAINNTFMREQETAFAIDASTVVVHVPQAFTDDGRLVQFISIIESLEIIPDVVAKVVINERTGTVVVGGNASILPVAISHGGINIEIQTVPVISQPAPFSQGQTVVTDMTTVAMEMEPTRVVAIDGAVTVQEIASALNDLQVAPRDIIAIFQALKEAGALQGELLIM
jgi:flagellar P-ring protein FlgI